MQISSLIKAHCLWHFSPHKTFILWIEMLVLETVVRDPEFRPLYEVLGEDDGEVFVPQKQVLMANIASSILVEDVIATEC